MLAIVHSMHLQTKQITLWLLLASVCQDLMFELLPSKVNTLHSGGILSLIAEVYLNLKIVK